MYEKLVTFEEEKRKEHLYLLYNSVFVCACLMCFFEPIFSVPMLLFKDMGNTSVNWFFATLLKPLCVSAGALCPFFIYNFRMQRSFKKSLAPQKNKVSIDYYILGIVSVVSVVPILVFLGDKFCEMLVADGYVIHEAVIDFGQGIAANVFYIIYTAAVSAFLLDLAFRGVVAEKLSHAHVVPALFVPALIAAVQPASLFKFPFVFVSAVIIGWCYLKTHSLYLSMSMTFAANVVFYIQILFKQTNVESYEANILLVSLVGLAICVVSFVLLAAGKGLKLERPVAENYEEEYDLINGKQALVGFLKAFGLWTMIFIFLFKIFFTYLDKPMRVEDGDDGTEVSESYSENE